MTTASDARGALSVLQSWVLIGGCFALPGLYPAWWTVLIAVIVLGGQQLGLAVLMHECSHRSLFASRALNDHVGHWLAGSPIWNRVHDYRTHHMKHHNHTGTDADPDMGLVDPFPTSRASLARKFVRDLTGVAGLKRMVGLLMMDFGLITYTVSTQTQRRPRDGRTTLDYLREGLKNTGPMLVSNAALAVILWAASIGWTYWLWVAAWFTTFGLFIRIRSIAEHACTERTGDIWKNTRTTHANPVMALFIAPHQVNYHLEHHLLMTVPHYKLERFRKLLEERGALDGTPFASGYGEVLKLAATR